MVGRLLVSRAEPGFTLPAFERLAPPPARELLDARIDAASEPGDVVADLFGRGGWVARAAIDRNRRGFSLESSPLTRLLAEVVLRPPDLRHLDAAFSALSASPQGETSLRLFITDLFATKCRTCGRNIAADELEWRAMDRLDGGSAAASELEKVHYRCPLCRDQQGRNEHQAVEPTDADRARATREVGADEVRRRLRDRFPVPEGADQLVDSILALHTDRQLVGLAAILGRIEGDLRAAPVESALRLAFLHAVLPASRLGLAGPRIPALRLAGGTVKSTPAAQWRERNPWIAFEDGFRQVRGFVQRLESNALGPLEARLTTDLRSLVEGTGNTVLRVMTPGALATLARETTPPIRLVLGQPPARFSQERLGAAYHGTCWALGREAASLLPLEPLLGSAVRAPWSWQAAAIRRALEAAAPHLARDARVVLLLEHGGPEALAAAVLGGAGAGYRILEARLTDPDDEIGGVVELSPPGAALPPPARNRGNQPLELASGGRGDPDMVPGPGMFAPPERIEARPFSPREAAQTVLDTAIEVLRARGEPASYERLLGEILVGLDRSGQLRRLIATEGPPVADHESPMPAIEGERTAGSPASGAAAVGSDAVTRPARVRTFSSPAPSRDPVDRLLALVNEELNRANQHRVVEIEPGRWWLGDRQDRDQAAIPLADRVEWAVYSLLSTAGPMSETAFFERMASLFQGHDLPDEALVRACLASYRSPASTPARLVTTDDLRKRTAEHTELLARLANGGHRLGMRIWIGRREQSRRIGDLALGDFLDHREREPWFPTSSYVPKEDGETIDCIWYQRGGSAFLFEVEWTAMLGDVLLRRHGRIPPDDRIVRFLAIPPERRELVRHKLETSPVLRDAIEQSNWHFILWPYLRAWLEHDPPSLADLEPYLGLEPAVERRAEQMNLFETGNGLP
ncbi:MAG TPA: hypothetical protein VHL56_07720 [Candidatus Limnocylindrales bacterium]|nr:hypothetical protein [Candidatus Limnocylindrales bacterium]